MPRPETLPKDPRRRFSGMTHTGSRCAGLALVAGMALVLGACPQLLSDDFRVGTAASNGDGNRLDAATGSTGCSDGAQDDGETGVDCGGPCAPCGCTWSPFSTPEPVTVAGLPASSSLYGPALSADGSTLFFSSLSTGTQDVYSATRSDRGAVFGAATDSAFSVVNTSASEISPRLSADGLRFYLSTDFAIPQATGGGDLYVATRSSTSSNFGIPTAITILNSTALDDLEWLSSDELRIYFSSTRTSGPARANLWFSKRATRSATFDAPQLIGELDTESNDEGPSLSLDELTLYFASDRNESGSLGKFDLWAATRASTTSPFTAPTPVPNVNSAYDEKDVSISTDGTELFFSSDRGGSRHTLWRSTRKCQ